MRVRSPRATELAGIFARDGVSVTHLASDLIDVEGELAAEIGDTAASRGIPLHELTPTSGTLEDAYLRLTGDDVEYKTKDL